MHFSIPDTVSQSDAKGNQYTGYCLHINGVYHCLFRYRQLHSLHEQLKREYVAATLPSFPPKKLFPLTEAQIEERRLGLEKYLQLISQDPRISNGQTFNSFLLTAQQETRREKTETVSLDVYLMNDQRISLSILTIEQTDVVLEQVCSSLKVPTDLVYYFSLYLIRRDDDGDITVVRKLQDFESPYISQKALTAGEQPPGAGPLKIVLRKSSWDSSIDDVLFSCQSTLNLVYIQTVADLERGWILCSADTKQQLALMQARGAKRQYMEVARTLKHYGCMVFRQATTDHPEPNSRTTVTLGKATLHMRLYTHQGEIREAVFKVTRMRCWRIMTTNSQTIPTNNTWDDQPPKLELSFEYLVSPDRLEWITIVSNQAILMSLCLQSIVEELVRLKGGGKEIRKAGEKKERTRESNGRNNTRAQQDTNESCTGPVDYTVRKLAERFSVVNMKATSRAAENVFVENEAFSESPDEL